MGTHGDCTCPEEGREGEGPARLHLGVLKSVAQRLPRGPGGETAFRSVPRTRSADAPARIASESEGCPPGTKYRTDGRSSRGDSNSGTNFVYFSRYGIGNYFIREFDLFNLSKILMTLALFSAGLHGQTVAGSIVGSVIDTTNGVIVGADVRLIDQGTRTDRTVHTDAIGAFRFSNIAPSVYCVAVKRDGFKSWAVIDVN